MWVSFIFPMNTCDTTPAFHPEPGHKLFAGGPFSPLAASCKSVLLDWKKGRDTPRIANGSLYLIVYFGYMYLYVYIYKLYKNWLNKSPWHPRGPRALLNLIDCKIATPTIPYLSIERFNGASLLLFWRGAAGLSYKTKFRGPHTGPLLEDHGCSSPNEAVTIKTAGWSLVL